MGRDGDPRDFPGLFAGKNRAWLIGQSPRMLVLFEILRQAARIMAGVLIEGESGSGKELFARALHEHSPRKDNPFIAINCATLGGSLIEDELLGHVAGAFTGADRDRIGLLELADGGTILLDEVGELNADMQSKLLRVIEEKEYRRLGDSVSRKVDVWILAATNKDLWQLVGEGKFRLDLYYRLKVVRLQVPPLRERGEDLPLLVAYLLSELSRENRRTPPVLGVDAMQFLANYPWPGNVRELRNCLDALFVTPKNSPVSKEDVEAVLECASSMDSPLGAPCSVVDEMHRAEILEALRIHRGKKEAAAKALGISRPTLDRRMRKLGLLPP